MDLTNIRLGMTQDEVKAVLGEPTDWSIGSRKYPTPACYLYGRYEFGFGPYKGSGLDYVMDRGEDGEQHDFILSFFRNTPSSPNGMAPLS